MPLFNGKDLTGWINAQQANCAETDTRFFIVSFLPERRSLAVSFDFYHKHLGIPPADQPRTKAGFAWLIFLAVAVGPQPEDDVLAQADKRHKRTSLADLVADDKAAVKAAITATEITTLPTKHTAAVARVAFHPTRPVLVSVGIDGRVLAWDVDTRTLQRELHNFANTGVRALAFNPTNGLVAMANSDWGNSKLLVKTIDGQQVNEVPGKSGIWGIACIACSPDGRLFATGQDEGTIRIWDGQLGELKPQVFGEGHHIFAVSFGVPSSDRKHKRNSYPLAAGGRDGILRMFTVTLDGKNATGTVTPGNVTFQQASEIFGLEFSPDGEVLGCTRQSGRVSLLNPTTGETILELVGDQPGERAAKGIAFHPNRPWCVTAHKENVARLWNTNTGELLCELGGHTAGVTCAQFSPDGRLVATASEDFSIKLWEINDPTAPPPSKGRKKR